MVQTSSSTGEPPRLSPAEVRAISGKEFRSFQALILAESGIYLSEAKRTLLVGRLTSRLRELGLNSFKHYYELVVSDSEERVRMLDRVSTNETHFFREPQHFEFLERSVFPQWLHPRTGKTSRRIRVLSAGCSTGEEPYSLAMILSEHFPASSGWSIEIFGVDISTRVLERARAAVWPIQKAAEIPQQFLKAYMLRGKGDEAGKMKAGPEVRSVVQFLRCNLAEEPLPAMDFDLIFCRNVLIYFQAETKTRVISRLLHQLVPGGYLFLGHAEALHRPIQILRGVMPTVYQRLPSTKPASATANTARFPKSAAASTGAPHK